MIETQISPQNICNYLKMISGEICPQKTPVHIPIQPESYSTKLNCYPNVERKLSFDGGCVVYGWSITELKDIFYEFQHHSVWRSIDGKLIDITPSELGHDVTLFLEDSHRPYTGTPIESQRFSIGVHDKVSEFLSIYDEFKSQFNKMVSDGLLPGNPVFKLLEPVRERLLSLKKEIRGKA